MTTLSRSLRSPSRFPPFAPFLSPRSRLSGCLFPAHVREKTDFYDVNSSLLSSLGGATLFFMTGDNALPLSAFALAFSPVKIKIPVATADMRRHSDTLRGAQRRRKRGLRGENRGIHERDPCRLTWAISGDFRLVVLGILLYSCVLRTKTRSKIAPWQVQRSFARRICAKAMKSPQTIRRYWQGL